MRFMAKKKEIQALHEKIMQLKENSDLEVLGHNVKSTSQFQSILDFFNSADESERWKLFPLMIGLRQDIFSSSLQALKPNQLQILQHEASSEPVQHHLNMMSHEFSLALESLDKSAIAFKLKIEELDSEDLGMDDVEELMEEISEMSEEYKELLSCLIPALTIVWNTGRPDLVSKFSSLKEHCQKSLNEFVGINEKDWDNDLHAALAKLLNTSFGDAENPGDIAALHDDEHAIEALAKFNIWYPQDFFKVGLLPHLISSKELDLDPGRYTDEERIIYRNDLLNIARQNLEQLGLETVKDIREAGIFSKKSLADYIKNKNL